MKTKQGRLVLKVPPLRWQWQDWNKELVRVCGGVSSVWNCLLKKSLADVWKPMVAIWRKIHLKYLTKKIRPGTVDLSVRSWFCAPRTMHQLLQQRGRRKKNKNDNVSLLGRKQRPKWVILLMLYIVIVLDSTRPSSVHFTCMAAWPRCWNSTLVSEAVSYRVCTCMAWFGAGLFWHMNTETLLVVSKAVIFFVTCF